MKQAVGCRLWAVGQIRNRAVSLRAPWPVEINRPSRYALHLAAVAPLSVAAFRPTAYSLQPSASGKEVTP